MKIFRKTLIFTITVLMLIVTLIFSRLVLSVRGSPRTWIVDDDGPADFHMIQEAVDAANIGDTILVHEGTYYEHISLNRSILLVGESRYSTIIDGGGTAGDVVEIKGSHVSMSNFMVKGGATYYSAIVAGPSSDLNVSYNLITECDLGIVVFDSSYSVISGNSVYSNYDGITLRTSSDTVISENAVSSNGNAGITLLECDNNEVSYNTISNNSYGIYTYSSNHNVIFNNRLIDNVQQVGLESSTDQWYDTNLVGNYWSDYTGADLDHNGIGDTPQVIEENNTDNFPLMGLPYLYHALPGSSVNIISNSTIISFIYLEPATIRLQVTNSTANQTTGFCRMTIPHTLINPDNASIQVIIDDGQVPVLFLNTSLYDNGVSRCIYFAYTHSTREISVIPENPLLLISLFAITALVELLVRRKRIMQSAP